MQIINCIHGIFICVGWSLIIFVVSSSTENLHWFTAVCQQALPALHSFGGRSKLCWLLALWNESGGTSSPVHCLLTCQLHFTVSNTAASRRAHKTRSQNSQKSYNKFTHLRIGFLNTSDRTSPTLPHSHVSVFIVSHEFHSVTSTVTRAA